VEHEAGVTIEPGPRLGMLVRAVIVEDYVDDADSDDVARSFRDHVARCSDMMSPA
jgi:hypothetical protein